MMLAADDKQLIKNLRLLKGYVLRKVLEEFTQRCWIRGRIDQWRQHHGARWARAPTFAAI